MGRVVVRAAMSAGLEEMILRLLRSLGGGTIGIERAEGKGLFPDILYSTEGAGVPDLGECQVTVNERRSEGSDWLRVTHEYTLEPKK